MNKPFNNITVIGTGTLGTQIALLAGNAGYSVTTFAVLMVNSGSSSRLIVLNDCMPTYSMITVSVSVITLFLMENSAKFIATILTVKV